jgi:hypothetical protein
MFNLNTASERGRKAAAIQGVWSGKWEPEFDGEIIATVYNRNYPDGIKVSTGQAEYALSYSWSEIRSLK